MAKVAVLGLGAMGARIAARLAGASHKVSVWNRTAERSKSLVAEDVWIAGTPREAVTDAELVISMVRDDTASRSIWLDLQTGAAHGMPPGAIAVEASTLTLSWTRELAAILEQRGVPFLDAPVVGSRPQADAGQLIQLIGGDQEVLTRAVPIFEAFSAGRYWYGPNGAGTAMKLAVNALFGIQVAALAELIAVLRKDGIEPGRAAEILGALPVLSPAAKGATSSMVAEAFAPLFPVELVEKDFGYTVAAAECLGSPTPVTASVRAVFAKAVERGFGGLHLTGVSRLYE